MKNYCTETDLKGYFPEIADYLHNGETDFAKFKLAAEQDVASDILNKGYLLRQLQTPLNLINDTVTASDVSDAGSDSSNRLRVVYNVTAFSEAGNTFTLQGANEDEEDTDWNDIETVTVTATGENSFTFTQAYKFYRVEYTIAASGSLNFQVDLIEINYDRLFCYKWLELILMNASKAVNDKWWDKMIYFRESYNDKLGAMVISVDADDDGETTELESSSTNLTTMHK